MANTITTPSIGTHAADGFEQGPQYDASYGTIYPFDPVAPVGRGSFNSPIRVYDIKPLAASLTNVAAANTYAAAGYVTLITSSTGGNVVTSYAGQNAIQLDTVRALQITGYAGTVSTNFTIYGIDGQKQLVTEQIVGPAGATTVVGKKTYSYILRIYQDGNTTGNISIGCADVFGLPYLAVDRNYITPYWGGDLDNTLPLTRKGTATLTAGDSTVANQNVNSASLGFSCHNTPNTAAGLLSVPTASIVPASQFLIDGSAATAVGTVNYTLLRPGIYQGTAQLNGASGTVTVTNPYVTATSLIFLTYNTFGAGTEGTLTYDTVVAGTSFRIVSSSANDSSTVNYYIVEPSNFAGQATLAAGTVTVTNPYIVKSTNGTAQVLVSRATTGGTAGFLGVPIASITNGTSFVINSYAADATVQNLDTSVVNWLILNPQTEGIFTLPDQTDPAVINGGDVRGTYAPSTPSDGQKRLTISMYVRGTDRVADYVGTATGDATLTSTIPNLYGVAQYTDTNN